MAWERTPTGHGPEANRKRRGERGAGKRREGIGGDGDWEWRTVCPAPLPLMQHRAPYLRAASTHGDALALASVGLLILGALSSVRTSPTAGATGHAAVSALGVQDAALRWRDSVAFRERPLEPSRRQARWEPPSHSLRKV